MCFILLIYLFLVRLCSIWPLSGDFHRKPGSGRACSFNENWATLCWKCGGNNSTLTCWQTNCALPIKEMCHYLNEKSERSLERGGLTSFRQPAEPQGCRSGPSQLPDLIPPPSLYCISISLNPSSSFPFYTHLFLPPPLFMQKTFLISTPVLYFSSPSSHGII